MRFHSRKTTTQHPYQSSIDGSGTLSDKSSSMLLASAEKISDSLIAEAIQVLESPKLMDGVELIEAARGVEIYGYVKPCAVKRKRGGFYRSFFDRINAMGRHRPAPTAVDCVRNQPQVGPRVFGRAQVHGTIDEIQDIIDYRSSFGTALLHPGLTSSKKRQELTTPPREFACLRSVTTRPGHITATASQLLVLEHQRQFSTASGQTGFVVSFHTVRTKAHAGDYDEPPKTSLYRSGVVAIESASNPNKVHLFCAAEMNLNSEASDLQNFEGSRHRVVGSLSRIAVTVEERAKMLHSMRLAQIRDRRTLIRHSSPIERCVTCLEPMRSTKLAYTCHRCKSRVCGNCRNDPVGDHIHAQLCMECWVDTTNRGAVPFY